MADPNMPHQSLQASQIVNVYPGTTEATADTSGSTVHIFIAFDEEGRSYRVGVDSFAEVSLISPTFVRKHWNTHTNANVNLSGIGGKRLASIAADVPLRLQWAAPLDTHAMFISETPPSVDILMGLDVQDRLGTHIDRINGTVSFSCHKLNIKTEPSHLVMNRMQQAPITVVSTNSGCNFAYAAVRNAGLQVKTWYSVEENEKCPKVSDTIIPANQLQHIGHKTQQVTTQLDDIKVDLFIDSSNC